MPAPAIRIGPSRRHFSDEQGRHFVYLADTAWALFHRLSIDDTKDYLQIRANQGFNVIQAVLLAQHDGLRIPNANGDLPLEDCNPRRPVEKYFRHIDSVVELANSLGLTMGLLPTWGDKWNQKHWHSGPQIFDPDNAAEYGRFLGSRYRSASIVWILGGDNIPETPQHYAIIRSMARAIKDASQGKHLLSFHPCGQHSSAEFFHEDDWLDFNMCQTGHSRDALSYRFIQSDYVRFDPVKPIIDAEPGYEDYPNRGNADLGYIDAQDARRFAWWNVLAGAAGHAYGANSIWQFASPGSLSLHARMDWRSALSLPGASQMRLVKDTICSGDPSALVPDQHMCNWPSYGGMDNRARIAVARHKSGMRAIVYLPVGQPVVISTSHLVGTELTAIWLNPANGHRTIMPPAPPRPLMTFTPPMLGPDFVLILESKA